MAAFKGLKGKVEKHGRYKTPCRIYDIESKPSKKGAQDIAEAALKKTAGSFKIKPDLSQLRFDKVKENILGNQVLYQQYHEGKPISGAWVRVDIDNEGRVFNIQSDLVPETFIEKTRKAEAALSAKTGPQQLSADDAKRHALEAAAPPDDAPAEVLLCELVYYPHNGVPTLAWKAVVKVGPSKAAGSRPAEWKLYLDASDGAILEKRDLLKFVDGKGRVFDPNPVVTLNDTSLGDATPIPDTAYREVVLLDLSGTGFIEGPFANTSTTPNRVKRADHDFRFTRGDRAFKEAMVYFHIDRMQRHIQGLGFDNVLNRSIPVHIDGRDDDNSHYSQTTKDLTFGTGGVDDAEDAEIIIHEYGHAVQDDQVPGFGAAREGKAMGEGFGDFLAASFFADSKPKELRPTLGNWDATSYSGAEPPCLRRLDSNKLYPKDYKGKEKS
ncbi:MAG TPA: M36 family metallopeptidase, partial [Pyrinomonadaceae bacterium]